MRIPNLFIALTLILLAGCSKNDGTHLDRLSSERAYSEATSTKTSSSDSASTVQQDYAALKRALKDGDGKTAASLVTDSTLREYETCRKLALDSSGTDFADLNQLTVMMIFQLRYLLATSELQEMSGREIFEWGVSGGMVKKETLAAIEIHKVQYDTPTAFATVTQYGKVASDAVFTFRKEDGRWKLDMIDSQCCTATANRADLPIRRI